MHTCDVKQELEGQLENRTADDDDDTILAIYTSARQHQAVSCLHACIAGACAQYLPELLGQDRCSQSATCNVLGHLWNQAAKSAEKELKMDVIAEL